MSRSADASWGKIPTTRVRLRISRCSLSSPLMVRILRHQLLGKSNTVSPSSRLLDYCNSQGIAPIEFVEDTTSGRRSWRDREIGRLLETADAGDVLVAAEVSRLARSTLQVLELLQAAADRGVTVHIAKNRMVLDQSLTATITATILGLAAQIEREFISARTKEALARRKAAGLPVGRPKGRATKLMLDDRRAEIVDYLNKRVSKRSVAKILGCSPTTLYSWIRRRRISGR